MSVTAETDYAIRTHSRIGFYVSMITAVTTLVTFAIAFMTPPISGPFCLADCFEYPYSDIVSRFPRDYYWMYPTMLISVLSVILFSCIHSCAGHDRKIFSRTGMVFAAISAAILIPNYWVQVSVVQASLLSGETEGIALITQYNQHGVFIALEEIGFLLMNLSFFVVIPVFAGRRGIYKAIRLIYLTGFILAWSSLILIAVMFGHARGYIFEITIISIVWLELIVSSILMGILFYRHSRKGKGA